jgi:hypothetical protein
MTGTRRAPSAKSVWIANSAAFKLSVSNVVSGSSKSTPPSRSPRACSLYAAANSSKLIARNPGFSTSGDSDAVRLVGPIAPATNRGRAGVAARRAAATASSAAALFIS